MKTKKLLMALEALFDKKGRKRRKHHDELEELLARLRQKRKRLAKKMREEKNEGERERLERKLMIVKAQIDKGAETLKDIEAEQGKS